VSGLPSPALAASATTSVTVGLNRATVGPTNSNVAVTFQSVPGASVTTGTTAVGNGTIAVSGTGWRAAALSVSSTSVHLGKFHVGASNLSGVTTVSNTSTADGYSEGLAVIASGSSGGAAVGSVPGLIAAGGNGSIGVGLGSVSAVGQNAGMVTLDFESSGQGTSGLANLGLGSRVINVTATGYSGQAAWSVDADGQWNTFASWDEPGGKPGVDGALSTNDTAAFGGVATANRQVRLDGANPVLTALTFSNSTARYTIAPGSGGSLTLGTSQSAATVTNAAGSHSIAANVALARATSVDTAQGAVLTLAGGLSGAHALTKTGLGELAINGIGSLSGTTTVAAGVLRLNGSIADSDVTVEQGATLMGSGTAGSTVVYGTHSPGNSPDVQTISGDLTYQGGSSVLWELVANTVSGRGTSYDGIDVTGGLTFSGTTALDLSFNFTGSTVDWGDSFWATSHSGTSGWLVYDGATSLSGFANLMIIGTNWADSQGNMLQTARAGATFSTFQDGNNVYLVYAVPEPATWALLATAAAVAWPFARRRRAARP
jgi:autotransporter-associated beta strand protein